MAQGFLSDTELYYAHPGNISGSVIHIDGEESKHAVRVMRHNIGDPLYITDGKGKIYETEIISIGSDFLTAEIINITTYEKEFPNIRFVIPRLKSADRFEFALEKCVELGITEFIVFNAKRSVAKGEKTNRWRKIILAAMKQSLRPFLPEITFVNELESIITDGNLYLLFDQKGETTLPEAINEILKNHKDNLIYFIFGPEGGLTEEEIGIFNNVKLVKLTGNRLRSETAVITSAAGMAMLFNE